MVERQVLIIDRTTRAVVEDHVTGGHDHGPYTERSITLVGRREENPDDVKLSMAPLDLREEILAAQTKLSIKTKSGQDI